MAGSSRASAKHSDISRTVSGVKALRLCGRLMTTCMPRQDHEHIRTQLMSHPCQLRAPPQQEQHVTKETMHR
jgi:hypothetical protein